LNTEGGESSERLTQVTIPEIVDAIYSMILEDRRIFAKILAETLSVYQEREGYIIHKILDRRNLSAKWVSKCLNACQKHYRMLSA
jgi:hypothetical protein